MGDSSPDKFCGTCGDRFTCPMCEASPVVRAIAAERERQDTQWGGPEHDDQHEPPDWCAFIKKQLARATIASGNTSAASEAAYRERLVKIAALAYAAIETHDRRNAYAAPATSAAASPCACRAIQAADPRRHFKGCPEREKHPAREVDPEIVRLRAWAEAADAVAVRHAPTCCGPGETFQFATVEAGTDGGATEKS